MTSKARSRMVGLVKLDLKEDDGLWILKIHRTDPYGGEPFEATFETEDQEEAEAVFGSIKNDEDIDAFLTHVYWENY